MIAHRRQPSNNLRQMTLMPCTLMNILDIPVAISELFLDLRNGKNKLEQFINLRPEKIDVGVENSTEHEFLFLEGNRNRQHAFKHIYRFYRHNISPIQAESSQRDFPTAITSLTTLSQNTVNIHILEYRNLARITERNSSNFQQYVRASILCHALHRQKAVRYKLNISTRTCAICVKSIHWVKRLCLTRYRRAWVRFSICGPTES